MTATDLFLSLVSRGFSARAERGHLLIAPASRLTAEDRAGIKEHRGQLLLLLGGEDKPAFLNCPDPLAGCELVPWREWDRINELCQQIAEHNRQADEAWKKKGGKAA